MTALVAWPLTKLDLVVDRVDLVFRVSKSPRPADSAPPPPPSNVSQDPRTPTNDDRLAESHISVAIAHDFVSHELLPSEDAELRASLHLSPSLASSVDLPGAFGGAARSGEAEQEAEEVETTVLAGLIERVLARLGVKVKQVRARLLWETEETGGEHELELRVDEIEYSGDAGEPGAAKSPVVRGLQISPPQVYLRLAEPSTPSPSRPATDRRYSSESDSSSGDEADLLAMSQSIADLRTSMYSTRSGGSSSAGRSDLFASARSAPFQSVSEEPEEDDPFHDPDAEVQAPSSSSSSPPDQPTPPQLILSLGTSDKPITLLLSTLLPISEDDKPAKPSHRPVLSFSAESDAPWTCAITADQLAALLSLAARFAPPQSTRSTTAQPQPPARTGTSNSPNISLSLRAVHLLVALPSKVSDQPPPFPPAVFSHSDTVVEVPHLYLRLDGLGLAREASTGAQVRVEHIALTETSALAGRRADDEVWRTLPLLVDEVALGKRSSVDGPVSSPDWVRLATAGEGGPATGQGTVYGRDWRMLQKSGGKKGASKSEDDARRTPALTISSRSSGDGWVIDLAPLHAFIDLGAIGRLVPLLDMCLSAMQTSSEQAASQDPPVASTPRPASPDLTATLPPCDILDDFANAPPNLRRASGPREALALRINCPLLRLEVRCPAPKDYRLATRDPDLVRSGRLIVDVVSPTLAVGMSTMKLELDALAASFATKSDVSAAQFLQVSPLAPRTEDPAALGPSLTASLGAVYPTFDAAIPLVRVKLDKPTFDGLQLFADDISQYLGVELGESSLGSSDDDERHGIRGTRMIGSRYFGVKSFMHPHRRRRESETESTASTTTIRGRSEEGELGARQDRRTARAQVSVADGVCVFLGPWRSGI